MANFSAPAACREASSQLKRMVPRWPFLTIGLDVFSQGPISPWLNRDRIGFNTHLAGKD